MPTNNTLVNEKMSNCQKDQTLTKFSFLRCSEHSIKKCNSIKKIQHESEVIAYIIYYYVFFSWYFYQQYLLVGINYILNIMCLFPFREIQNPFSAKIFINFVEEIYSATVKHILM